jgi:hypothetical protein
MNSLNLRSITLLTFAAIVAGFLIYTAVSTNFAYHATLLRLREAYSISDPKSVVRYATAVSSDAESGLLTVRYPDPFTTGDSWTTLNIVVGPETVILKQELLAQDDGTYYALSPFTPATLQDVTPGMRVRIHSLGSVGKKVKALMIVLGNTL